MKTKLFTASDQPTAAKLVQQGELIAFPTETVYGLGADALNEAAVKKVYEVKGRPSDNPLIVHVDNFQRVTEFIETVPASTQILIETFWPGPLTLIFKAKPNVFSKAVTGGLETVAFRMPNNQQTLALIEAADTPLVGPSANTSGKPSPTTAAHVLQDLQGKIAGILDDGPTEIGVESTVLDLTAADGIPVILRPGAITYEALTTVIGKVKIDQHLLKETETPKAPGMKYKHYAPETPVWIVTGEPEALALALQQAQQQNKVVGLFVDEQLATQFTHEAQTIFSFGERTVQQATKQLFAGLRKLDEQPIDLIFAQGFPEDGLGSAYMNRLKKAANQKKVEKETIF